MLVPAVAAGLIVESATVRAGCPDSPDALVLITEMANDGSNTFVEIYNPGVAEVNLTGWWICINPEFVYAPIALDELDALAPGGVLVLQLGGELDENHADRLLLANPVELTEGDFALYFDDVFPDFASPDDIRDYLQWGASGQNREEVGNDACIWTTGDFIPVPLSGSTFQLAGDAITGGLTDSTDYTVHSFALNNLRIFPPPPPTATGDADGDEDVDLHDWDEFLGCNLGPETPADTIFCTPNFDFDADLDIDWVDFAALQIAFTGPPVPVGLTISGPDEVGENSTAGYSATVTYTLGLPETLTDGIGWSVEPPTLAIIDTVGMLMTFEVDGDQSATITAAFSFEGMPAVEDTLAITITDESEAPEPVDGTIAITELAGDGTNTYVELYNTGDLEISLTDWWLCLNPEFKYEEIAAESCDVLAGREVLVIQLGGTLNSSLADHAITISPATLDVGDIGLYVGEVVSFDEANYIREYLQWGAAGQERENVGAEAGLWNEGSYVDASLADGSVQLVEGAVDLPLTEIDSLFVTPFSEHSLGVFPNPAPSSDGAGDEGDGSGDDPEAPGEDDPDSNGESPDEDPSEPIEDGSKAGDGPGDENATEDPGPGAGDPEPPAEDEVPTITDRPRSARSGLCGLFGMVNFLTLITGLTLMKRLGHGVSFI